MYGNGDDGMKALYLECGMGASGDMLAGALLDVCGCGRGCDDFLRRINGAGIPGVEVTVEAAVRGGIAGSRVVVRVGGEEESAHSAQRSALSDKDARDGGYGGDDGHCHDDDHHIDEHHHDSHFHDDNHHRKHHHDNRCALSAVRCALTNITELINTLNIPPSVKKNALDVYKLIAEAESLVHGVAVDKIHFHEVGEMDAIADIVGVCMLIDDISPELILASPVNVGGGEVRCAHGILPVPAPATAHILKNIPIYSGDIKSELCTPTGAALLRHFVDRFCDMPVMSVDKIGYGMGKKDFERANCLRAYLGEISAQRSALSAQRTANNWCDGCDDGEDGRCHNDNHHIDEFHRDNHPECCTLSAARCALCAELVCNLDDMTPESVAFAQEQLLLDGALDVYVTPTIMKKGRAGVTLTCVCRADDRNRILPQIFKHTTTLGIRERLLRRYTLLRDQSEINTEYGTIRIKTARGFGTEKSKPEYEDMAAIARDRDLSILDVEAAARRALEKK